MEFGMGSYDELDRQDFTFKPEGRFYIDEKPVNAQYRIGLPRWTDMEKIANVKQKDSLQEYGKRFNAIFQHRLRHGCLRLP